MTDLAYMIESADTRISDACPEAPKAYTSKPIPYKKPEVTDKPKPRRTSPRCTYKTCLHCGEEFEPSGARRRLCDECMIELKVVTMCKCAVCGAEFAAKNARHKYCSEKCAGKNKLQLNRSYKTAHKDNNTAVSPTYEQELLRRVRHDTDR